MGNGQTVVLGRYPSLYKKTGGLFMYRPPQPNKDGVLLGIAPILSGVETEKKIQSFLCRVTSDASFMRVEYYSLISNF